MKTILKIAALVMMVLGYGGLIAQNCDPYFVNGEGEVREMTSYDKKDKLTGTTLQTVKVVKTDENKTEWTIGVITKDKKGEEITSGDLQMSCENGIFKMDMKNFLNNEMLESFEGMEITMDASDLDFPSELSPGQDLKDGQITVKVANAGIKIMTMDVKIYDRKVLAIEDMTTPAGTFSCYKMSSTIETKSMFSMVVKSTDWVAKNVGAVRSESFDKNGKLTGYSVLTSLK